MSHVPQISQGSLIMNIMQSFGSVTSLSLGPVNDGLEIGVFNETLNPEDSLDFQCRSSTSLELPVPSWPPTTEDWNARREVITKLYQHDELSLKEVQEIMLKEHGFRAK
jgi:Clr5 domain